MNAIAIAFAVLLSGALIYMVRLLSAIAKTQLRLTKRQASIFRYQSKIAHAITDVRDRIDGIEGTVGTIATELGTKPTTKGGAS